MRGEEVPAVWHTVVAVTALLAAGMLFGNPRLRLHDIAVLLSALAWAATFLVFLPWLAADHARESDIGSAIGSVVVHDCCGLMLGGYHLLLCAALGLKVLREGLNPLTRSGSRNSPR